MKERNYGFEAAEALGDDTRFMQIMLDGCQHYTNTIVAALGPISCADLPFVIFSLGVVVRNLLEQHPDAAAAAENLKGIIGTECFSCVIPGGAAP